MNEARSRIISQRGLPPSPILRLSAYKHKRDLRPILRDVAVGGVADLHLSADAAGRPGGETRGQENTIGKCARNEHRVAHVATGEPQAELKALVGGDRECRRIHRPPDQRGGC